METEAKHRADRPELSDHVPGVVRFNPHVQCTGGRPMGPLVHPLPCPMHHPSSYARGFAAHRGARQAVAS